MMNGAGSKVKNMKTYENPYLRIEKRSPTGEPSHYKPNGTKVDNNLNNYYEETHHVIKEIKKGS